MDRHEQHVGNTDKGTILRSALDHTDPVTNFAKTLQKSALFSPAVTKVNTSLSAPAPRQSMSSEVQTHEQTQKACASILPNSTQMSSSAPVHKENCAEQRSIPQDIPNKLGTSYNRYFNQECASTARFAAGTEIMRQLTNGALVIPVKSFTEIMQDEAPIIALIKGKLNLSSEQWQKVVQPAIEGCASLCMMLPPSTEVYTLYQGTMLHHCLKLALITTDWVAKANIKTKLRQAEVLGISTPIASSYNLQDLLKSSVNTPTAKDLKDDSVKNVDEKFALFDGLSVRNMATRHFVKETFRDLINYESMFINNQDYKVIHNIWKCYLPRMRSPREALQDPSLHNNFTKALKIRYNRLMLLESLLATPAFTVNDFEAINALDTKECETSLEKLAIQERFYINSTIDAGFFLNLSLGLTGPIIPELNQISEILSVKSPEDQAYFFEYELERITTPLIMQSLQYATEYDSHFGQTNQDLGLELIFILLSLIHGLGRLVTDMNIRSATGEYFDPLNPNAESLKQFIERTCTPVLYVYPNKSPFLRYSETRYTDGLYILSRQAHDFCSFMRSFVNSYYVLTSSSLENPLLRLIEIADRLLPNFEHKLNINFNMISGCLSDQLIKNYQSVLRRQYEIESFEKIKSMLKQFPSTTLNNLGYPDALPTLSNPSNDSKEDSEEAELEGNFNEDNIALEDVTDLMASEELSNGVEEYDLDENDLDERDESEQTSNEQDTEDYDTNKIDDTALQLEELEGENVDAVAFVQESASIVQATTGHTAVNNMVDHEDQTSDGDMSKEGNVGKENTSQTRCKVNLKGAEQEPHPDLTKDQSSSEKIHELASKGTMPPQQTTSSRDNTLAQKIWRGPINHEQKSRMFSELGVTPNQVISLQDQSSSPFFMQRWAPSCNVLTRQLEFSPLGSWSRYSILSYERYKVLTELRPLKHYYGFLPEQGLCEMNMQTWREARQGINNIYAGLFVTQDMVLFEADSASFLELQMQVHKLKYGEIQGQNINRSFRLTLEKAAYKSNRQIMTQLKRRRSRICKVIVGNDLVLCQGVDFKINTQEIAKSLPSVKFSLFDHKKDSANIFQYLFKKTLIEAGQAILDSFEQAKDKALNVKKDSKAVSKDTLKSSADKGLDDLIEGSLKESIDDKLALAESLDKAYLETLDTQDIEPDELDWQEHEDADILDDMDGLDTLGPPLAQDIQTEPPVVIVAQPTKGKAGRKSAKTSVLTTPPP